VVGGRTQDACSGTPGTRDAARCRR
jgi:hypothetical protein